MSRKLLNRKLLNIGVARLVGPIKPLMFAGYWKALSGEMQAIGAIEEQSFFPEKGERRLSLL
jgi:hypothetical protein